MKIHYSIPSWFKLLSMLLLLNTLSGCSNLKFFDEPLPQEKPQAITFIESHKFAFDKEDSVIGQLATVNTWEGDTFSDIARHYGLGFQHLVEANPGIEPWAPDANKQVLLPLQFILPEVTRKGIVINLAAMRLFYFSNGSLITYPVGIGKEGRSTPTGLMRVERKTKHPVWYVPESIRNDHARKGDPLPASVPSGPDNPLGDYAFYLSEPSYLIHGTNKPYSIGFRASNGCIRLYPENIDMLFSQVPEKAQVKIVNQPYLMGTLNGELYLEAHQPYDELNEKQTKKNFVQKLKQWEKKQQSKLDWDKVEETLNQARGIPVPIQENLPNLFEVVESALHLEHPDQLYLQPDIETAIYENQWYIWADESIDEHRALSTAAMLNHQGPRIPAQTVAANGKYQVLTGPYKNAKVAKAALKRMKIDLEIAGKIIPPLEK